MDPTSGSAGGRYICVVGNFDVYAILPWEEDHSLEQMFQAAVTAQDYRFAFKDVDNLNGYDQHKRTFANCEVDILFPKEYPGELTVEDVAGHLDPYLAQVSGSDCDATTQA